MRKIVQEKINEKTSSFYEIFNFLHFLYFFIFQYMYFSYTYVFFQVWWSTISTTRTTHHHHYLPNFYGARDGGGKKGERTSENSVTISFIDKVKNLGVIFDSRLSFEHHIKSLCSRLNETLSYLNRVKNTLDKSPGYF